MRAAACVAALAAIIVVGRGFVAHPSRSAAPASVSVRAAVVVVDGHDAMLFATLFDRGGGGDTLIGATSADAALATVDPDAAGMDAAGMDAPTSSRAAIVSTHVALPPGGDLVLERYGAHVDLSGLAGRIHPGGTIEVTLEFHRAGAVRVVAPVIAATPMVMSPMQPGGMEGHGQDAMPPGGQNARG